MGLILVLIYLVALYVRPQDWIPFMLNWPTAYVLIPLGLVAGFLNRAREPSAFRLPQNKLILVYLGIIFVSTLLATDVSSAIDQFEIFLKRAVVFFMIIWIVSSKKQLQIIIWALLLLSGFLAYQAILQGMTGESWGGLTPYPGYAEIRVRWYGDWDGPNVLGILFVIAVAAAMGIVFGQYPTPARLLGTGLMGAYFVAIYLTASRGTVLALICVVLFYFRGLARRPIAIAAGVAFVAAIFALGPSRLDQIHSGESSAHERTWLWEQGLNMLEKNPILGIGRGQFVKNVDLHLIAHNNYVQNFAETGLSGFFCFISLLWFSLKGSMLVMRPEYGLDPRLVSLARMMATTIIGYSAATFFVVMELDLLYLVLGLSASVYLVARRECDKIPDLSFTRFDLMVITGGMTGLLGAIWVIAVLEIL